MSDLLARFQDREETVYSAELYLLRKLAETSSDMVKARDWEGLLTETKRIDMQKHKNRG
jgi:hypothetical protein